MKFDEMVPAILLITVIGILIGVGVVVLLETGDAVRSPTTVSENVAIASGSAATANTYVTALTEFGNGTVKLISNNESASTIVNLTGVDRDATAVIVLSTVYGDGTYNANYSYDAATPPSSAITSFANGLDDFVIWIPIIVIVIATSIILALVMSSFRQ